MPRAEKSVLQAERDYEDLPCVFTVSVCPTRLANGGYRKSKTHPAFPNIVTGPRGLTGNDDFKFAEFVLKRFLKLAQTVNESESQWTEGMQ